MFQLDQQDLDHIAPEGWLRLASIVAMALDILGPAVRLLPRGLAARALAVLRPCEAMARRLLYLIAPTLPAIPAKAGASSRSFPLPAAQDSGQRRDSRKVAFRFSEPLGSGPKATGPHIRFLDGPSPPPAPPRPPRPPRAPQTSARLLARIAALQHVIDHPDAHARRLARWLARRRATGAKRPVPFNFENVPGLNRQRLDPMLRDDALFFNDAAFYKATAPPG